MTIGIAYRAWSALYPVRLGRVALFALMLVHAAACVAGPVPSERQLAWQGREVEVFIHFGMNSTAGREWGTGREDPSAFDPAELDARQWVAGIAGSGAAGVVLVCKHHDGFCLWPTETTPHSVRASRWRGGKGDLVRDVADACRERGLKFGVYLSPHDLHEPSFGRDAAAYNEMFRRQLRELLNRYGEVAEVWFDGAKPSAQRQAYDFPSFYRLIRELQPGAVIVSKGPDVRWVGNEAGVARDSEWSPIPLPRPVEEFDWPDLPHPDLGSRARIAEANVVHWYPAVCDVSLGPDWFWDKDWAGHLKSLPSLKSAYVRSVGRNAGLLINVGPDRRGLLPDDQIARLREFGDWWRAGFATNAAPETSWRRGIGTNDAMTVMEAIWSRPVAANTVVLREDIRFGQVVEGFHVEGRVGDAWVALERGTTIGNKRILRCARRMLTGLRVTVEATRGEVRLLVPELHEVRW